MRGLYGLHGWNGAVLRVNLSTGEVQVRALPEELAFKYIGGRGLNAKVLYDEVKPGTDPLGPDNKLIFGVGPCNGTLVPGSSRFTVTTKSPMSGLIGDSNCGGSFGATLKYAGYDMLIIEGKANRPVYLLIDDDTVQLKDAGSLWGKKTPEARRAIVAEVGDPNVSIGCIGPAGENLVRFASATFDIGRTAGRPGIGAVMGSKNLKAVAVRGTKSIRVARPSILEEAVKEIYQAWRDDPKLYETMTTVGISALMQAYHNAGILPTRNYQQGQFERIDLITGQRQAEWFFLKPKACFSCPVACNHLHIIDRGPYTGTYNDSQEMGQTEFYSSMLGIDDLDFTIKGSSLCNEYGVDMIEMAHLVAHVMEAFQRGILTLEDTGGLRVEWGRADAALELMRRIVYREGIGDVLAEGSKRAMRAIGRGAEALDLTVKGLSISTRDPRGSQAWGLGYAVASRGSDHCRHMALCEVGSAPGVVGFDPKRGEVLRQPGADVDPSGVKGKGQIVKWYEDVRAFQNCMEACLFLYMRYPRDLGMAGTFAKLFNAATGLELSSDDVMTIGERILNLERAYNIREGLSRNDDTLPRRLLEEPLPDENSPARGRVVNLKPMLDEYYEARGWDQANGYPTRAKLESLDLKEVADELESLGRLGHVADS